MPEFPILKLKCSNCGHEWIPRQKKVVTCANCKVALERHEPSLVLIGDLSDYEVEERDL
mgnify:CR=1 FL=1